MNHIKTAIEEYYLDDRNFLQGEYKSYRENGDLYVHNFYVDGKRQGEYKSYRNSSLHVHCFYEDGKYHGEYKLYRKNGELINHCFYVENEDVMNEVKSLVCDIMNIADEEKVILKLQLGLDL